MFSSKPNSTPLPKGKMVPICILLFCEAFNGNSIFSYVAFLVIFLKPGLSKEDAGYYAGLVASVWFLAQFISSFFWGRLSDVIGRKPVLILGVLGSMISSIAFGFSFTFPFAIFARALNGILNGNIGVVKTYIAEVTDSTNQARAFGMIGLMYGLGGILGSVVGGYTAKPWEEMPWLFSESGFFGRFPFLLPNLISALLSFAGFVTTIVFVQENTISYEALEMSETSSAEATSNKIEQTSSESDSGMVELQSEEELQKSDIKNILIGKIKDEEVLEDGSIGSPSKTRKKSLFFAKKNTSKGRGVGVLKDRYIVITCTMYALVGFASTMFDEVWPLWAIADKEAGGLGFDLPNIGTANAISGLSIAFVQLFIYPHIANVLKLKKTFQLGMFMLIPIAIAIPCISSLNDLPNGKILVWIALLSAISFRQFCMQCAFSAVMALITNSCHFQDMGAANGLGQSLVALCRAVGPAAGGAILAWTFNAGHPFPFNYFLVFFIIIILGLVPTFLSFTLPTSLNLPKNEAIRSALETKGEMMEMGL